MKRRGSYEKHRHAIAKRRGFLTQMPANDVCAPSLPAHERSYRRRVAFGADVEHRAFEAFSSGDLPPWFVRLRPASDAENHAARHAAGAAGIDMWVDSDQGPIPVQVKSSAARAALFREEHPDPTMAIVVLHVDMEHGEIRSRVLDAAKRAYDARERARANKPRLHRKERKAA